MDSLSAQLEKKLILRSGKVWEQNIYTSDKLVIAGRLILAAFVGYIISIPVEILAFKQEILAAIVEEDKNVKVTEDKSSSKTVLQNIISRIKEAEEKYKIADKAYHNYNTSGAKISNIPKDSQQYRITLLDRESEKNKAELALKEAQIEYEMCNSTRISCWTPNPGLMRLYKTIDKLDDKFSTLVNKICVYIYRYSSVLTKISKKTDNYDVAIASKESKKKANFKLEQITLNTEIEILENKFKFKKEKMEKLSKDIEDKIQENITGIVNEIIKNQDSQKNIKIKIKPLIINYMLRLYEKYFSSQNSI